MSYLNALRLHFAGRFQAAVSTVNNDPVHFDNAIFEPSYQKLRTPTDQNGWWNPEGDAAWRLIGCQITSAFATDGNAVDSSDAILSCLIADSDRKTSAKLVDLDAQQQQVSEIWGLEVRICDQDGRTLLRGHFKPIGFMDLWACCSSVPGTPGFSAMYQSVLTDLEWGDLTTSRFLQELRAKSPQTLSIKFNVDGYNNHYGTPGFTYGRIAGTLGPAQDDEPQHFVAGRQLLTVAQSPLNFCVAVVDEQRSKLLVDLGNALPTDTPAGPRSPLGTLSFGYTLSDTPNTRNFNLITTMLEEVYTAPSWYETTAGVIELPADRSLTSEELEALSSAPLAVLSLNSMYVLQEDVLGAHVRMDQLVYRLNPGEQAQVTLYATRFGKPYSSARIITILDPSQLQQSEPVPLDIQYPPPAVATPLSAIAYPTLVVADENGVAMLPIQARAPGNPRNYLDGQVYGLRPILEELLIPGTNYVFDEAAFISLLVWDDFKPTEPPTWWGTSDADSLQPIFQQYANLYPVMLNFLDLGDYTSVCNNRMLLLLAFSLDVSDPNSMPVTRDLSAAKRKAILTWLSNPGPDGNPLEGTPRSVKAVPTSAAVVTAHAQQLGDFDGSKATSRQGRVGNPRARS